MPIATPETYRQMIDIDTAKKSSRSPSPPSTVSDPKRSTPPSKGFADAGSDGIIQFSTGGAEFANSHMWDGSAIPGNENLDIVADLLRAAAAADIILEIEIGVVGGEEDGVEAEIKVRSGRQGT